jgi:TonB-dependent starch-binding outer membrane protein SusC
MKKDSRFIRGILLPLLFWVVPFLALAQTGSITGKVTDAKGAALPGAAVSIKGTTIGSSTDAGGFYNIPKVKPGTYTLVFSFLGFKQIELLVDVKGGQTLKVDQQMEDNAVMLKDEVVVVGYGVTQSRDLTGSVVAIQPKSFQQGNFATPEQMVVGKVAGVQITSNSGAPGAGSTIRVRGGTSIRASNEPLIVIDGVPVEGQGIAGSPNPLSLINPDDIESFTILKDASAAAIYGSRAANGVIIITTKQGTAGSKINVEFSTTNGVKQLTRNVPVLSADAFRQLVNDSGTAAQKNLLTDGNTNWQDEVFRLGFTTDNNLSVSGGIKSLPYRLGLEYYREDGILKTGQLDRKGISLRATPSFLNNHIKVDINAKYSNTTNRFADVGAIGSAVIFDPTKPIKVDTSTRYNGFFEYRQPNGRPNLLAPRNPVGLLEQRQDNSSVNRFIGNALFDYKVHGLPELHLFVNIGTDYMKGSGTIVVDSNSAGAFLRQGVNNQYEQTRVNQVFDSYFNYARELKGINSKFDLTGGYSFQYFNRQSPAQPDLNQRGDTITPAAPFEDFSENALMSFYTRLNYSFRGKYLLTATMRADGSSRFSPENRWGYFPSVALAWRMSDERFFQRFESLSNLKMRFGWGVTGQQDIVGNDYPYIANYGQSTQTAQYQFGNQFYYLLRPAAYDINIKWEETASLNFGFDYGFFNNRLYGTIDLYRKTTKDLINEVPIPGGTNFSNFLTTNVGSMLNSGVEVVANVVLIDNKKTNLELGGNFSYNKNEITELLLSDDPNYVGVLVGGIGGGVGNTIQVHSIGSPVFSFFVYEQLYDESGKPLEGKYKDQNGDGTINNKDLIRKGGAIPTTFASFYGNVRHGKWSAGFSLRGEFGRYVYNNVESQYGNFFNVGGARGYLANVTESYNETKFRNPQYLSDYYVQKANFIRMDNIYVGYNFGSVMNNLFKVRVSAAVQNAFVISSYSGLDPEVVEGRDNNIYPRARVYTLNVNLNF